MPSPRAKLTSEGYVNTMNWDHCIGRAHYLHTDSEGEDDDQAEDEEDEVGSCSDGERRFASDDND